MSTGTLLAEACSAKWFDDEAALFYQQSARVRRVKAPKRADRAMTRCVAALHLG
jgi:hypothetical protein